MNTENNEFLEDVKNAALNPSVFDIQPEVVKEECPKCESLSLINNACVFCHFEKPEHLLGEPLGKRSFYSLREHYLESLNLFERTNLTILQDQGKFRSLLNKTKYRYNDLLDFFYDRSSLTDPHRAIFLQELTDIVIFFIDSGVEEREIWLPIGERDEEHMSSLFLRIRETIQASKLKKSSSLNDYLFLDRRISKLIIFFLVITFVFAITFAFLNIYQQA